MPTIHSVSKITDKLSDIIREEYTLQNVWVNGKVSSKTPSEGDRPDFFMLEDAKNGDKIECVIYKENSHLFEVLPTTQNDVIVNGRIVLFESKSEYRFAVTGIETPATALKSKIVSVSDLTSNLQTTLKLHSGKVQGKISNNPELTNADFLRLNLKNSNTNDGADRQMIECQFVPRIVDNLSFYLRQGDEVSVEGQFDIFPTISRYQIIITEADNVQRILCADLPENEDKVEEAVEIYFSKLDIQGFSPKRQHGIQMGSDNRITDVVLVNGDGSFAAIVECKGAGHVGHGVEQLKSYLCATDTRFGIFANRTDPEQWEFYENRRRNRFDQINRSEFEAGVVKGIATRERLKDEIKALEKAKDDLGNKESELETEIAQLMQTERDLQDTHKQLISEIGKKRVQQGELETEMGKLAKMEYDLQDTHKQLRKEIETTTQQHADFKQEITELRNQKLELKTEIEKLERKESELHASRKQWKEKIQQFETFLADMKSDLLDSEPSSRSDNNVDPQRAGTEKKLGIVSKLKNLFSKENK